MGLDHEIYDLIVKHTIERLSDRIKGDISISKDDRNFYVSIYIFNHYFNYRIDNVDLMDLGTLDSAKFAAIVYERHRRKIFNDYFT